jgi:hypothetical protein
MPSRVHLLVAASAAGVAVLHTLLGPDHYLPFVGLSRAHGWSRRKLALITAVSGFGHVLSSVGLGLAGAALGLTLARIQVFQEAQARWAAWGLIAFGLLYAVWGLRRAGRQRANAHGSTLGRGGWHAHAHEGGHVHVHLAPTGRDKAGRVPASLIFALFLLGPCEPLVPLVLYPAARRDWIGLVFVVTVFSLVTVATMVAVTLALDRGAARVRAPALAPYGHALAGATVAACGAAIVFLGL